MRGIAIARDGYSDYLVIKKFLKCLFETQRNEVLTDTSFIDLEQLNIINPLVKYIDKASKDNDHSYHSAKANSLVNELIAIYYACYKKLSSEIEEVTNKEVIIINADSEKLLVERKNYFSLWAYNIKALVLFSIEKFYEEMINQGHQYEYLPVILPLILFPSSEILVASCMYDLSKENMRQFSPTPVLKEKVYGTSSIPKAIESGILEETLNTYITSETLKEIFKEIPEARILMHTFS